MFGALSHDLRTLLTRLRLRIDSIGDPQWRKKADADLTIMNDVIENGLALARLDASSRASGERIEVGEILRELVRSTDLTEDMVTATDRAGEAALCCDPHMLLRGLRNLTDNAHRYGVNCAVVAERVENRLTIDVTDDGPGINPEELERLLRPFERGDKARPRTDGGSGLGLAIAKRAAERAGGKLTLYNRSEGGFVARVDLPLIN